MFNGAYYLAGYSIECALKACIAKKTKKYDFPNKDIAQKAWTHNLEDLFKVSELKFQFNEDMKVDKELELNWNIIKDWSERARYEDDTDQSQVKDFISACTSTKNGILTWIKKRW